MKPKKNHLIIYSLFFIGLICIFVVIRKKDKDNKFGSLTDIDGNHYKTVVIGNQVWMAEKLRTTTYNDGTPISGGLSNKEWQNTTSGAYSIYPHADINGINSDKEMLEAYGALYNWYAVETGNLCPAGWRVPSDKEWIELTNFLITRFQKITLDNVGNSLKSCRQVDSPLEGECDTNDHPRWKSDDIHYGTDDFGFSALPGGYRSNTGNFRAFGDGRWWTSTEYTNITGHARFMGPAYGGVFHNNYYKQVGLSVRCIKDVD